jgi:flagellum-specific peptidoglycan hydrolase FlgJ
MAKADFFTKMLPYAKAASDKLNIPVSVILAQWANESGFGTSSLAQRAGNYAGITHTGYSIDAGASGAYADYKNNMDMFIKDYTRVMNLSYYKDVRAAVSVDDTITALSKSPYAESGYNGGKSLLSIIKQYGLTKYDNGSVADPTDAGTTTMNIPVEVPQGASQLVIGLAVIAAGVAILKAITD